ncbi:hypothetical protein F2Q70_00030386 [Brassica cretica]|uniref:Uncharacterized protein n=1 Tax=Brassica cretica TaxID=69181 RepID=A0A8S9FL22_BRACR|nr:hypothetical protein F2Q70_00030386 [Brassica cretica]
MIWTLESLGYVMMYQLLACVKHENPHNLGRRVSSCLRQPWQGLKAGLYKSLPGRLEPSRLFVQLPLRET